MSTPAGITITAHPSHWYDILTAIFKALGAANPAIATIIPAPVEGAIQIALTAGPVVAATVEAATEAPTPEAPAQ
jgi:hypothetical protein